MDAHTVYGCAVCLTYIYTKLTKRSGACFWNDNVTEPYADLAAQGDTVILHRRWLALAQPVWLTFLTDLHSSLAVIAVIAVIFSPNDSTAPPRPAGRSPRSDR
jgi:hypothetical protein